MANNLTDKNLEKIFHLSKIMILDKDQHEAHAVELLRCYLEFNPEHNHAWILYGDALRIIGRASDALPALLRAFNISPVKDRVYVASRIAKLMEESGSPKKAKKWYKIMINACNDLGYDEAWPWVLCGANLATLGEFRKAINCYEIALQKNVVDKDEVLLNIGFVHRATGEYSKAIDCFRQALVLNSNYEEAKSALLGLEDIHKTICMISNMTKNTNHPSKKPSK
jgi:tetratricopeptide (TPR) repeat protein